jgi:hypothetical protein
MGVTYGYVVGDFADAARICDRHDGQLDHKAELVQKVYGIGPLRALEKVLCGQDSGREYWDGNNPQFWFAASEEGPFLLRLPRPLVEHLVTLPDAVVPEVAARWTAAEEFAPRFFPDTTPAELRQANGLFLGELVTLARQATASGLELLMWAQL